ncbi:SMI1/KNR4 family protein, partial [Phocaeicola vulgatus]
MIEALKNIGFVVTERLERKELSSDLQNRYSELPADYQEFLQRFQTITNESDNVWFN